VPLWRRRRFFDRFKHGKAGNSTVADPKRAHAIRKSKLDSHMAAWAAATAGDCFLEPILDLHSWELQEIRHWQSAELQHVRIIAWTPGRAHPCPACTALAGQLRPLADEVRNPSLPPVNCTCTAPGSTAPGFCLCSYEGVFDDELAAHRS
jgi:hypothetical protein